MPTKTAYKVGEGFDTAGFDYIYYNSGSGFLYKDDEKVTFQTSDGVKLTQGRKFTTAGKKVVEIRYNGKKVTTYTINVSK